MAVRIVLLLMALGGLTVFALQNSISLRLVFLGIKTQALPLGFWILAAVVAGVLTALVVAWLLEIINSWGNAKLLSRIRQLEAEKGSYQGQSRESAASTSNSYSYSAASSYASAANTSPTDSRSNEEWEEEDEEEDSNYDSSDSNVASDVSDRNYEAKQEPTTSYRSGSVYSYGYKNPSDSAVGRTESVYDAEYRVITPPYRPLDTEEEDKTPEPSSTNQQNNDDDEDWGFDDDEDWDFDDKDKNPRSR
ncbi:LapA family protein [Phormidium sp. LEGE 05292]|uniref:LapA family protein n=1 Tax=[Phormidium] sp. LEGE 05292 TaxID=767427 RepID=UPI00187EFE67|nr:LapA family protein [Phormidium sp. LEGE 05292]MBE9226653.1 LapA family protein [Phormidium sp. LEGE 05292]